MSYSCIDCVLQQAVHTPQESTGVKFLTVWIFEQFQDSTEHTYVSPLPKRYIHSPARERDVGKHLGFWRLLGTVSPGFLFTHSLHSVSKLNYQYLCKELQFWESSGQKFPSGFLFPIGHVIVRLPNGLWLVENHQQTSPRGHRGSFEVSIAHHKSHCAYLC